MSAMTDFAWASREIARLPKFLQELPELVACEAGWLCVTSEMLGKSLYAGSSVEFHAKTFDIVLPMQRGGRYRITLQHANVDSRAAGILNTCCVECFAHHHGSLVAIARTDSYGAGCSKRALHKLCKDIGPLLRAIAGPLEDLPLLAVEPAEDPEDDWFAQLAANMRAAGHTSPFGLPSGTSLEKEIMYWAKKRLQEGK